MTLPFDGAIDAFYKDPAQAHLRALIDGADGNDVTNPRYPYPEQMPTRMNTRR
jgi:polyphosphate kinase